MPASYLSPTHYEVYGQYNGSPGDAQLSRYFYLDDFDHEQIANRRQPIRRLGFALQLTSVRFLGTYPQSLMTVPDTVVAFVSHQLSISSTPEQLKSYSDSQRFWIINVASMRFMNIAHSMMWVRHINFYVGCTREPGSERPSILFDLSVAWLIDHKVLLPGITVLERLITTVRERTEKRSWQLINRQLTSEQQERVNQLVSTPDVEFDYLRKKPTHISSPQIRYHLDRLEAIRRHNLHAIDLSVISRHRLRTLADYALMVPTSRLRRLKPERKSAVIVAGIQTLAIRVQDLILNMVDQWLQETVTKARNKFEKQRLKSLSAFDRAAFQLRDFAHYLIALPDDQTITIAQLFQQFQHVQIEASITTIDQLKRPENRGYRNLMLTRYGSARRFLPSLLRLLSF